MERRGLGVRPAVLAGLMALLLPAAVTAAQARYARLGEFEGTVDVQLRAADQWMAAERNLPLPEAAWVRTGAASRLEIELDEGSAWRLGPNSQGEISDYTRLSTGQRVTLLSLDHGLAYFTGQPEGKDALTLAVPGAQVTMLRGARVRLEVQESWSQIVVLEGLVRFSSPAAEIDLREGQTTRVEPANPARFFLDKNAPVMELDRWSEERDKALASSPSAGHAIERYGLADLDAAGEWIQTQDLGSVWKPKVAAGWVPYQVGRWRWYDALGYTWISDDAWGWLPYHYGRWTRLENIGWVWAPAKTAVFKPGEVYWMRGTKMAAWGPLAPGEDWNLAAPPLQYLNVNTTFASFQQDAVVVDPVGFTGRPKDPLTAAPFVLALPSPAMLASRLDATRPELRAGSTRVVPMLSGVTFQGVPPNVIVTNPPPPPPVIVITPPADPPDPQGAPVPVPVPVGVAVPVAYPVPVYTGIVVPPDHPDYARRPPQSTAKPATPATGSNPSGSKPPAPASPGPRHDGTRPAPEAGTQKPERPPASVIGRDKKFHAGERDIAWEVMKDINGNNFNKALVDLDSWTRHYRESDYQDDRAYYYVLAHNGIEQPAKVLESAAPLVAKAKENGLDDPRQMILVLYLTSVNAQKLPSPTREQRTMARAAATGLLESVPSYFTPENRPSTTSTADWMKARTDIETAARTTLQAMGGRR